MEHVVANKTVGISELKVNPAALLLAAQIEAVAILDRNKPAGYLVNPQAWEAMLERLEDADLAAIALPRLKDGSKGIKIKLDAL